MPQRAINSRLPVGEAPSSRGQGHRPLTAKTRVRIPVGSLSKVRLPKRIPTASAPTSSKVSLARPKRFCYWGSGGVVITLCGRTR